LLFLLFCVCNLWSLVCLFFLECCHDQGYENELMGRKMASGEACVVDLWA
jgi:hypothetical protein